MKVWAVISLGIACLGCQFMGILTFGCSWQTLQPIIHSRHIFLKYFMWQQCIRCWKQEWTKFLLSSNFKSSDGIKYLMSSQRDCILGICKKIWFGDILTTFTNDTNIVQTMHAAEHLNNCNTVKILYLLLPTYTLSIGKYCTFTFKNNI